MRPSDDLSVTGFNCELVRLNNPHEALWAGALPIYERLGDGTQISEDKKVLLFIHGIEYGSRDEVLRDLVRPLERNAQMFRGKDHNLELLFIHWDSKIKTKRTIEMASFKSAFRGFIQLGREAAGLHRVFETLELRAMDTASRVYPVLSSFLNRPHGPTPLVITHSLGALVWCELVSLAMASDNYPQNLGHWWNLQPALEWDALNPGKRFGLVSDAYCRKKRGHVSVWFSKIDFVLSTLFLMAKGKYAMGQVGGGPQEFTSLNLTKVVGEAHGQASLRRSGCFFTRVHRELRIYSLNYLNA